LKFRQKHLNLFATDKRLPTTPLARICNPSVKLPSTRIANPSERQGCWSKHHGCWSECHKCCDCEQSELANSAKQ